MQTGESSTAGVSRSGRLRKKSTKLMEMEESEKVEGTASAASERSNAKPAKSSLLLSTNNSHSLLQSSSDTDGERPLKKKLKIKLSIAGNCVEERSFEEDDSLANDEHKAVVPPVKIKLLSNSSKSSDQSTVSPSNATSFKKIVKKSPIKNDFDGNAFNSATKQFKVNKKANDCETAANLLFKQITSGVASNDSFKKKKKNKSTNDDVYFGSDDNMDGEETSLVIEDSNSCLAAAVANAKKVKNPRTPKTSAEKREERKAKQKNRGENRAGSNEGKEKKKRAPLITAYTLFARENRPRIHEIDPDADFAAVSRRLGEVWQSLPAKEKMQWKKKALKLRESSVVQETESISKPKNLTPVHNTAKSSYRQVTSTPSQLSKSSFDHTSSYLTNPSPNEEPHVISTEPSDVAAHLRLLGESLSIIGQRLTEHSGQIAVSGSLSVLLDSTICALGPLLCLTTLDDNMNGCSEEVHKKTLDNISYIMPGI
ncbi:HMG box-containing protein 4-like protein [Dinothrombium tinctorium]|uniref:HMG box-containing protein 4-like protein n=1 Tax=Dinothrombium tinctorium TaxID=1965070 RepID=A0A3S3PLY7_9ACAR|nr:HMG box-containing protein 4-like protein [Dinothrombium tinctorium]RWS04005.1 HMG box-containing protein 4-like protein [Dinothrombium tinctorium]RWS04175.1 HMG box-containing protein 4-like protein [Dinothrombium tinctorium]